MCYLQLQGKFSTGEKKYIQYMYSGIRTTHPIIDPSSFTLLHEGLWFEMSEKIVCLVERRPKIHGVDNAPFSPRHRHGGMWPPPSPPLPQSPPPTLPKILLQLSSIIFVDFGKIPISSTSFLLWKRNCLLWGLNPGLLDQSPACSLSAMAESIILICFYLYGFTVP